jgi:5-methylcytosine-specific restriction endonuclease McrA
MTRVPKSPRVRLDSAESQRLRARVLKRDSWRCQSCGSMSNLEVHHARFRSQQGDDTDENLITLCSRCHKHLHG